MTPCGARGFGDVASAKAAVIAAGVPTYAIIKNAPRFFAPAEFAWIAPAEVFMERATRARMAGITLVEMVTG